MIIIKIKKIAWSFNYLEKNQLTMSNTLQAGVSVIPKCYCAFNWAPLCREAWASPAAVVIFFSVVIHF